MIVCCKFKGYSFKVDKDFYLEKIKPLIKMLKVHLEDSQSNDLIKELNLLLFITDKESWCYEDIIGINEVICFK